MTRRAAESFKAASTAAAPPKVLLKFGGYHVYRGLNPVHGSGIGNYVAEFAEAQGAHSLHWTMFDLRPLRHDVSAPGGAINPDLATLVFGYDILVIVPEGTPSTEIR